MATQAPARPKQAPTRQAIRKMGYEGETQRQVTNGWYCRGKNLPGGGWQPDPGLPSDVLVLLPMGAPYEREMYPDKGFKPLSTVPNKRAVAGRSGRGNPEFLIEPPDFDLLVEVMAALKSRREEAKALLQEQIDEINENLEDSGSLMKGEAQSLRKGRKVMLERLKLLDDDSQFDATGFYRSFVEERKGVIKAQMSPDAARHAELEREYRQWDEHLAGFEERPSKASPSNRTVTSSSTPSDGAISES